MSRKKKRDDGMPDPAEMAKLVAGITNEAFDKILPPGVAARFVVAVEFTGPGRDRPTYWQCATADDAVHAVGILQAAINSAAKNIPKEVNLT